MNSKSPLSGTERKAPFQWSPQVAIIVGVTFLMLTLPLALFSVALIQAFQPVVASVESTEESAAPDELRESLERSAKSLEPQALGSEQRIGVVGTDHVLAVVPYFGTSAWAVGEGRYWVRLPTEQRKVFERALAEGTKPETIPAAVSEPVLFEVVIEPSPVAP